MRVLAALLAVAAGLAGAADARADVLEIGARGPAWIAGGPRRGGPVPVAVAVAGGAAPAGSLTDAAADAGPAAWRARIAALAAKYDLSPALLEAVVWQESRWNPAALSLAGARGLAQLMPGTARAMGVDPANPRANLEGGARYLRLQLDTYHGNLERALAAYNAGPARVDRAGGVPTLRETQAYVAAIMARLSDPVRR